ncbi:hypothetical protein E2C01_021828 [Portunus trituberculatus]|uniref:Uncharacterized protein n=1 Tax=Portunus trituberculatus TaxID=210409 RepID=A0A5B7E3T9_PORTR|nr:hypothetical protein [Portunus trituberculatus]
MTAYIAPYRLPLPATTTPFDASSSSPHLSHSPHTFPSHLTPLPGTTHLSPAHHTSPTHLTTLTRIPQPC